MGDNNQILYVEDEPPPVESTANASEIATIKEESATMEESTLDKADGGKSKKSPKSAQVTDKVREKNMKFNTGRWTDEEHELFLEGLRMYEKDWELI